MTERLRYLCSLIDRTDSFIDVGCDHGYVVKYVSDNKLADRITACDISLPSLDKARKLLCGVENIDFVHADGKTAARGHDTVLVSGMGGKEIISVMCGCAPRKFIVSPQSHAREVRKELLSRDYKIVDDKLIKDGGKYYDVIKAVKGGGIKQLEKTKTVQLAFGMFLSEYNEVLAERLNGLYDTVLAYPPTAENRLKADEIKEAILWQLRLEKL